MDIFKNAGWYLELEWLHAEVAILTNSLSDIWYQFPLEFAKLRQQSCY